MDEPTKRECVVWRELSWGRTIQETAQLMGVRESTVRTHLKSLYSKLQVHNRVQLALKFHGISVVREPRARGLMYSDMP
jgi:DNA-binding NarL/FixJ family response regulator